MLGVAAATNETSCRMLSRPLDLFEINVQVFRGRDSACLSSTIKDPSSSTQFCQRRLPAAAPPGAHAAAACSTRQATHSRRGDQATTGAAMNGRRETAPNNRGPAWLGGSADGALRGCRHGGRRVPAPGDERPTAPKDCGPTQRGGSGERRPSRLPAWSTMSSSSTRRRPAYPRQKLLNVKRDNEIGNSACVHAGIHVDIYRLEAGLYKEG
jgi:hypothetical protein